MSKFKITNADSPIEKDLYQDIPIKDPETGLNQVDNEGNILAKRYVTRSINKNGINNIKRALPQININKSEIARIDTYAKNQVDAINTSIKDIEDNVLQNQKDLSDHDTRISTIQSKLNNIQGIDIDEVQADVDALKKSAYLNTGGVLNGDVTIQTPNTAVLTLTPKGSSSYASFSTTNDVLDCTTTWGKVFKASKEGKYFYGLADKATADKKGQDVTSYIRSIAGANATLTITKGDGTSQSLSINNVLQATKAIQDKNGAQIDTTYFKSANGTFTGNDYYRDVNNSVLRFNGGNTRDGGAALMLYGKNANGAPGHFNLAACTKENASDAKQFVGRPDGSLTWAGKNIVRSINGINANAFGDVALTQLVTGLITSTYLAGATGAALVSSTAPGGAYVAFTRGASKNGVFCTSTYEDRYEVHYINNDRINAGQNGATKSVVLLNEAGNSAFPGIVSGTFSGNLSGTASHATSADNAGNADTLDGYHHNSFPKVNSALFTVNGLASPGWSVIGTGKGGSCIQVKTTDNTYPSICFHRSGHSHCVLAEYDGQLGTMQEGNGTFNYLITSANIGSQRVNYATNANHAKTADSATNSASATKASQNASGYALADTIVKAISISGRTITVTKLDGKTYTLTTQDTNTWNALKGSTTSAAGTAGYAPAPAAGAANRYLRCDGTWQVPPDNNTTYSNMTAATASAAGKAGLVPAPGAGKQTSFLRGDGTWVVPTNTTYSKLSQFTNDSGYITSSGTAATISQKVDSNAKTHTNYNKNGTYVPTMNFLSYWNGAYDSSNDSNLTYCAQGTIIGSKNIGSQSVKYATSAGSVAWGNVSGRPTKVSQFTNDSGYITGGYNFASGVKVNGYTITVG